MRPKLLILGVFLVIAGTSVRSQNPPAATSPVDFERLAVEATDWLAGLVRINTTNPPGNELAGARYLASILQKEGFNPEVIETTPGRGAVVARLQAWALPDPTRAVLLLGHMDVVGVDASKWTQDAFGGAVKDGAIWGRGTIDDKGPLVANLATVIALKRAGVRLTRDVIFVADSDEEQGGGEAGIRGLAEHHWDKIAAGFCINEGGQTIQKDGKLWYVGVQASEKVSVNYRLTATGTSGHASIPLKDNAVVHLAAAIDKLGNWETPARPTVITKRYFEGLAQIEDSDLGKWMRALDMPERQEHATRIVSNASPVWNAMLRNTVSPTVLQAGVRANVIPSEARATVNVRLLPGELPGEFTEAMLKVVADPQVRIDIENLVTRPSAPSEIDTDFFRSIQKSAHAVFPGAAVLPMMSTWATDSAELRLRNVICYGLVPFPLSEEEIARMHADNERLPIAAIRPGIEFVYRAVEDFVRAP